MKPLHLLTTAKNAFESTPFPRLEGTRGGGTSPLIRKSFYQTALGRVSRLSPWALEPLLLRKCEDDGQQRYCLGLVSGKEKKG